MQRSLRVTSRKAAELLLSEYQLREAKFRHNSKLLQPNKAIIEVFTEYINFRVQRQRTKDWYAWAAKFFLAHCEKEGINYVHEIDIACVENFYKSRHSVSPGGARSNLRALKAVLNYAVEKGYIQENPANKVKLAKPVKKIFRALSFEEIDKLLYRARERSPLLFPIYATAYFAGLRANELRYLEPKDINFKENYIIVRSKPENRIKDHQERIIPLNSKLKEILLKHIKRNPPQKWLFETKDGRPRVNNLNRELKEIAKQVGINPEGMCLQVLRETFGSHLRKKGVDIGLISEYMGHSSIDVTLRHYAHIKIEQTHREIDRL